MNWIGRLLVDVLGLPESLCELTAWPIDLSSGAKLAKASAD